MYFELEMFIGFDGEVVRVLQRGKLMLQNLEWNLPLAWWPGGRSNTLLRGHPSRMQVHLIPW